MISLLNGAIHLHKNAQFPNPAEDAIWLAANVKAAAGETLLDVGCGTGVVSLCLKHLHPNTSITGIDIQAEALKQAAKNAELNHMDIQWVNGDITLHPFEEGCFDIIVSNPPFHLTEKGFDSAKNNTAFGTTEEMVKKWVEAMLNVAKSRIYLIHHTQNEQAIIGVARNYKLTVHYLETSPEKPAKRMLVAIDKNKPTELIHHVIKAYEPALRDNVLKHGRLP